MSGYQAEHAAAMGAGQEAQWVPNPAYVNATHEILFDASIYRRALVAAEAERMNAIARQVQGANYTNHPAHAYNVAEVANAHREIALAQAEVDRRHREARAQTIHQQFNAVPPYHQWARSEWDKANHEPKPREPHEFPHA